MNTAPESWMWLCPPKLGKNQHVETLFQGVQGITLKKSTSVPQPLSVEVLPAEGARPTSARARQVGSTAKVESFCGRKEVSTSIWGNVSWDWRRVWFVKRLMASSWPSPQQQSQDFYFCIGTTPCSKNRDDVASFLASHLPPLGPSVVVCTGGVITGPSS